MSERVSLTEEFLRREIVQNRKTRREIAEETGWAQATINKWVYRFGIKENGKIGRAHWNAGKRNPEAKRNQPKAAWWSPEHREKLAAAKRGKFGNEANRWRGGALCGDYKVIRVGGEKVYEHRYVAEVLLGRRLSSDEYVHHMDRTPLNNSPRNLIVLSDALHMWLHTIIRDHPDIDQVLTLNQASANFTHLGSIPNAENIVREALARYTSE